MKVVRLVSGNTAHKLTESEQNVIWDEVNINTNPVGKHSLFTPQDNIEYFIIEERELDYNKFELKIRTNGKVLKLKCNLSNQDEKINKAVREAN